MFEFRKLPKWKYQLTTYYYHKTNIRPERDIHTKYISLHTSGVLTINKGYAWDGATGGFDTKNFMRGSLVHDALCQLIHLKRLPRSDREAADAILRDICKEDGMCTPRAWWVHKAVRLYVRIRNV